MNAPVDGSVVESGRSTTAQEQNPKELYGEAVNAVYALATHAEEVKASTAQAIARRDEEWQLHLDRVIAAERDSLLSWHSEVLKAAISDRDEREMRERKSREAEVERLQASQQRCLQDASSTRRQLNELKFEMNLERATAQALSEAFLLLQADNEELSESTYYNKNNSSTSSRNRAITSSVNSPHPQLAAALEDEIDFATAASWSPASTAIESEEREIIEPARQQLFATTPTPVFTAEQDEKENDENEEEEHLGIVEVVEEVFATAAKQEEGDHMSETLPPSKLVQSRSRQRRSSVDARSEPRAWFVDEDDEARLLFTLNSTDEAFADSARKAVLRCAREMRLYHNSSSAKSDGTRVKVIARIRPTIEQTDRSRTSLTSHTDVIEVRRDENTVIVNDPYIADLKTPFTLDGVIDSRTLCTPSKYGSSGNNADVFFAVGVEAAAAVLNGINATVFSYGQTGSGKSHTVFGSSGDAGLASRIAASIFDALVYSPPSTHEEIRRVDAAYVEIYQDKIRDLLADDGLSLKLREHPDQGVYVEGVTRWEMTSGSDVDELLAVGACRRQTGCTAANNVSSRSHAALVLTVGKAQLTCVDLAGSERSLDTSPKSYHKQAARKKHLKEACAINASLSTLGRCVAYLAATGDTATPAKIAGGLAPFRDSPLTWFLREALCGDSRTWMIACVNSCQHFESLSTLRYAATARALRTRPASDHNQNPLQVELKRLKHQNADLRRKLSEAIRHLQHQKHLATRPLTASALPSPTHQSGISLTHSDEQRRRPQQPPPPSREDSGSEKYSPEM